MSDGVAIGPILCGLSKPAQILQMNATVSEILNLAALAAVGAIEEKDAKVAPLTKSKKAKA